MTDESKKKSTDSEVNMFIVRVAIISLLLLTGCTTQGPKNVS